MYIEAALNGNLDAMKKLKKKNYDWEDGTFSNAALNGNLDNMKWLKENGCPCDHRDTFNYIIDHADHNSVKWAKENLIV